MKNKQKMRMFQFCKNEVKGKIPFKRLVTLLVFCLFLTSCSSSQITLSNLLEEVNEEHKLVERKNIDFHSAVLFRLFNCTSANNGRTAG